MNPRLLVATVAGAAAVVTTAPVLPSSAPAAAAAAEPRHRAAVIVDTGQEVRRVCVRFDEEAISGAEILRRAGVDPVFAGYGSMGEAVCSLCGVGCPGDNCFCDRSRFWSYSRADDGRTTFTRSSVGASSTRVGDGDVEGWRWGTGTPPPFASVETVCGEVPAESAAPGATTTSTAPGPARSTTTTTVASVGATSTTTAAPAAVGAAETTTTVAVEEEPEVAGTGEERQSAAPRALPSPSQPGDDDSSSAPALVALAAAVGGLGAWWTILRRRRRA